VNFEKMPFDLNEKSYLFKITERNVQLFPVGSIV